MGYECRANAGVMGHGEHRACASDATPDDRGRLQAPLRTWLRWLACLAPFALFLIVGLRGLDYGRQWDEPPNLLRLRDNIETGRLLPSSYSYPSLTHWVLQSTRLPDVVAHRNDVPAQRQGNLIRATEGRDFLLRARGTFLILASFVVLWTFFLVRAWGGGFWEAAFGASLIAGAWEVGYHARWIAPDALLMQFGALTLWLASLAVQPGASRWYKYLAGAAAGLCVGTKYSGVVLLLPVSAAVWHQARGKRALSGIGPLVTCIGVFLVTTPGAVLEFRKVLAGVAYEAYHYSTGHPGYTVESTVEHLSRLVAYVAEVLLSPYGIVALVFFVGSLVGAYVMAVERRHPIARAMMVTMVVYFLYFGTRKVMAVRNLLLLAPPLSALAAVGFGRAVQACRRRSVRLGFVASLAALVLIDLIWVSRASGYVRQDPARMMDEVGDYLRARPQLRFYVSPAVQNGMRAAGVRAGDNVVGDRSRDFDEAILLANEFAPPYAWPGQRPDLVSEWFGPKDVNLRYSPTWVGSMHVVAISAPIYRQVDPRVLIRNAARQSVSVGWFGIAESLAKEWVKRYPDDPNGYDFLESVRRQQGDLDGAARARQKAGELPAR